MTVKIRDLRSSLSLGDRTAIDLAQYGGDKPYQTLLLPLSPGAPPLVFPYNPESYDVATSPEWADRELPGRTKPLLDWKRKAPTVVSVRVLLQLDDAADTTDFVRRLENGAGLVDDTTGEAETWEFVAGTFSMTGVIQNLRISRTRTDAAGDIDIADISFELHEQNKGFA